MAELTERQAAAFKNAKEQLHFLMAALYEVRYSFYEGNVIPPQGAGVWSFIPHAQSTLHKVEAFIEKAEVSVTTFKEEPK